MLKISRLEQEITSLQIALNGNQQTLDTLNNQLNNKQNEIKQTSVNLNNTINELELRQSSRRYALTDPLFWSARNFLSTDSTDRKTYDEETFNCANYAQEVNNNAENKGIRCAYVVVYFSDSNEAHSLIAFETTDQGLKFFEPQTDERVDLQIGKSYWSDCVIANGNYYYLEKPGDTIEEYTIYW